MKYCPICTTDYVDARDRCPQDGARLIDKDEWAPGQVIRNKYRIVACIGRGGMGIVYKAEHLVFKDLWALKVMNPRLSQEAEFVRRFYFEAEKQRRLKHRNVVRVDDVDQADDGRLFIGMEFVDGMPLREMLHAAQGPLAVPLALAIARGMAEALEAADALGIVHRDIKPDNVLLERAPGGVFIPKLTDFGVAKLREGTATMSKAPLLTPQYAAPEQWQPSAEHPVDGRTDLYALGMTLYEMLAGRSPFNVTVDREWMYAHLHQDPEPPSHFNPALASDPRLDDLVLRMLAKSPDDRPAGAREVMQALALIEATPAPVPTPAWGEKTIVAPRAPAPRPAKPAPRPPSHPAPSAPRAATPARPSAPPPRAATPARPSAPPPRAATPARPSAPPPRAATPARPSAPAPRAATPARVATPPRPPTTPRRVPSRHREEVVPVASPEEEDEPRAEPCEPAAEEAEDQSPDFDWAGASLAEGRRGRRNFWIGLALCLLLVGGGATYFWPQIEALLQPGQGTIALSPPIAAPQPTPPPVSKSAAPPPAGASPTPNPQADDTAASAPVVGPPDQAIARPLSGHTDAVLSVAFSPRGRWLASGSQDQNLRLWDYAAGSAARTIPLYASFVAAVAFSPNGRQIAAGTWNKSIALIETSTGQVTHTLLDHTDAVEAVAYNPGGNRLASGSDDRTVRIWNLSTYNSQVLKGHTSAVRSVAFSPDGATLASGGDEGSILLWDVTGGGTPRSLTGHSASVRGLAFLPTGHWLVSASDDRSVRLWNLSSLSGRVLAAGKSEVEAVAFSPDGHWLAAGMADNTVRLWDTTSWRELDPLTVSGGGVRSLAFSADGRWLAAACGDHTIRLWRRPRS